MLNLLTRARIDGLFPWEAIDDETRTQELNSHSWSAGQFAEREIGWFLTEYQRNKQQSQPIHIEIVAEKLTVRAILSSIAEEHSIPLTIARGHCGPTVKRKVSQRFKRSKKSRSWSSLCPT